MLATNIKKRNSTKVLVVGSMKQSKNSFIHRLKPSLSVIYKWRLVGILESEAQWIISTLQHFYHLINNKLKWEDETLFLAIEIFEKYSTKSSIGAAIPASRRKTSLLIIAATCLWIASKFCEVDKVNSSTICNVLQTYKEFTLTHNETKRRLIYTEKKVLCELDFNIAGYRTMEYWRVQYCVCNFNCVSSKDEMLEYSRLLLWKLLKVYGKVKTYTNQEIGCTAVVMAISNVNERNVFINSLEVSLQKRVYIFLMELVRLFSF